MRPALVSAAVVLRPRCAHARTCSDLLRPAQTCSDLLRPAQTCSDLLRPAQTWESACLRYSAGRPSAALDTRDGLHGRSSSLWPVKALRRAARGQHALGWLE